jgi:hypothetical protein
MPVQKGFERTPKTGGSQFGFESAIGLGCILTLFLRLGRNGSSPAESEHE